MDYVHIITYPCLKRATPHEIMEMSRCQQIAAQQDVDVTDICDTASVAIMKTRGSQYIMGH